MKTAITGELDIGLQMEKIVRLNYRIEHGEVTIPDSVDNSLE